MLTNTISTAHSSDFTSHLPRNARSNGDDADTRARQRAAILAFGRRIASRSNVEAQTRDAVSLMAEVLGCDLAGFVSEMDHRQLKLKARLVSDVSRVRERTLSYSRQAANSVVGLVMETGLPVTCSDLRTDERFAESPLNELGVVAVLAVPLQIHREMIGALVVMSSSERAFSAEDVLFAEVIAQLLSASIGRIRAECSLRETRELLDTVVDSVEACVVVMDPDGRITRVNRCCETWSGFASNEVVGRSMWNAFVAPKELQRVRAAFRDTAKRGGIDPFESWLKHKSGKLKRICWKSSVQRDGQGNVTSVVFSGNDVTRALQAEHKSRRLSVENERSQLAMGKLRQRVSELSKRQVSSRIRDAQGVTAGKHPWDAVQGVSPFVRIPHDVTSQERRLSPRRAYPYMQRIAPVVGAQLPEAEDFREVPFRDISAGGVSFLLWYEPDFNRVVVELGQGEKTIWVSAEVAWIQEIGDGDERSYLVGCSFVGREHVP